MSALQWIGKFPVVDALGWTLVHSLWQGLAIAIIVGIALRAMRGRSAQARYMVAIVAIMLFPACAIATFGLLNRQATPMRAPAPEAAPVFMGAQVQPLRIAPVIAPTVEHPQSWDQKLRPMLPWLVLAWAGGVIVLGVYQLGGWIVVRRMRRTGEPIDDACAVATFQQLIDRLSISRPVRLARSALVQVPTVIGWLRPVVLLPMNALTGLTSDQLAGLLAHELAHVRRHDYLVNILQAIIETLLFYHPAIWWMSRAIRQERENACDDLAAGVCDRATYAQALAAMESLRQSPALALSARGGALLPRIRRILGLPDAHRRRALASGLAAGSIVVAIVVSLVVLNACSSTTQSADKKSDPTTSSITEDDLKPPPPEDYRIGRNDLVQVSINDLQALGTETVKQARVSESGRISLMLIGQIDAAGKTEAELQQSIVDAYAKAGYQKNAAVTVTVIEARARTFSVLGAVSQPGQYAIPKPDFRLLDALAVAKNVSDPQVHALVVLRGPHGAGENEKRQIIVPLGLLQADPNAFNIVIRPDDLIVVRPFPAPDQKQSASGGEDSAYVKWTMAALNQVDARIRQLSNTAGADDPRLAAARREQVLLTDQIKTLRSASKKTPTTQNANETARVDPAIAANTADQKELELLKLEAESTTRIDAAKANLDLRKLEYDRKAQNPNAYTAAEIDEAKVHLIEAGIQVRVAQEDQSRAKLKYEQQQARLITPAIDPADLKAEKSDYTLGPSDLVSVSIYDLTAVGAETKREERITDSGAISMPLIGNVKIAGKTVADAEKAISKAYEDAAYLKNANVMLTLVDARSRSFTILFTRASAGQAGQYNIPTNDFRLLDALATSKAELAQIETVKVRRDGEDGHARLLEMRGGVLLTGEPQANVIIRPKDTIIVQTREGAQPMASSSDTQKLREQIDATSVALVQLKQSYGPQNPRVVATERQLAVLKLALAQRQDAVDAARPTPATQPSDNTAAHFVRVVVGKDRLTFEGSETNWGALPDLLKKVPDPANTALEFAFAENDIPIGLYNQDRGLCLQLVKELGFKYLSEVGEHPLGSKAGEEAPATQPSAPATQRASSAPKNLGEYYLGGHVKRTGVYAMSDRDIHLKQAVWAAGGFDDPKMGDDTLIRLARRDNGRQIISLLVWKELSTAEKDPVLHPDDVIEVGVDPLPVKRAKELWNAAIMAEQKQDWAAAIQDYEDLKAIDKSSRPQTDRQIDNAITMAKAQMAK